VIYLAIYGAAVILIMVFMRNGIGLCGDPMASAAPWASIRFRFDPAIRARSRLRPRRGRRDDVPASALETLRRSAACQRRRSDDPPQSIRLFGADCSVGGRRSATLRNRRHDLLAAPNRHHNASTAFADALSALGWGTTRPSTNPSPHAIACLPSDQGRTSSIEQPQSNTKHVRPCPA
jgi:hypothetical protein